jgi:hypothetical protein
LRISTTVCRSSDKHIVLAEAARVVWCSDALTLAHPTCSTSTNEPREVVFVVRWWYFTTLPFYTANCTLVAIRTCRSAGGISAISDL